MTDRRLLASIHDVGPKFEREIDVLTERLIGHLGGTRFAMLVVPDHWGEAPLAAAPAFQRRLREWADAGVEMFLHGWRHRDESRHEGLAAWKGKHMTAGEGEFLGLSRAEAARRMADGRRLVEDVIGRPVAGFIAPAWLYGEGARAALADGGFALAEDHLRVWRPQGGEVLAKGPVITWASRSRGRIASSLAASAIMRRVAPLLPVLRVAVHPGDVTVPALLRSIDRTFASALRTHAPASYGSLLAPARS